VLTQYWCITDIFWAANEDATVTGIKKRRLAHLVAA